MEPTGDLRVDEELARLDELGDLALRERLTVLESVHAGLQDRLADAEG